MISEILFLHLYFHLRMRRGQSQSKCVPQTLINKTKHCIQKRCTSQFDLEPPTNKQNSEYLAFDMEAIKG